MISYLKSTGFTTQTKNKLVNQKLKDYSVERVMQANPVASWNQNNKRKDKKSNAKIGIEGKKGFGLSTYDDKKRFFLYVLFG